MASTTETIRTATTTDGVRVMWTSDGRVGNAREWYHRTPLSARAASMVMDDVCLYSDDELPGLIRAARRACARNGQDTAQARLDMRSLANGGRLPRRSGGGYGLGRSLRERQWDIAIREARAAYGR